MIYPSTQWKSSLIYIGIYKGIFEEWLFYKIMLEAERESGCKEPLQAKSGQTIEIYLKCILNNSAVI